MSDLPGYDDWKTHNPDDDNCEHCGAHPSQYIVGWQPGCCTGACGIKWRDPDAERDLRLEDDRR